MTDHSARRAVEELLSLIVRPATGRKEHPATVTMGRPQPRSSDPVTVEQLITLIDPERPREAPTRVARE